ncbi:MAG: amino acid permease [Burkholderiales bacterium]|nr:amino acid permease [Burkholderiales bacterium]
MQADRVQQKPQLKDLSFIALFSLIFGSIMGSGVFDIPQNIAHGAGVIAISLGWIITTIGIMALSWAFVYITNKRPDIQSGLYGYAKHGFGNYVGFNSAWGYALNAILANTSYLVYICATLGNFVIFKFLGQGNTLIALMVESGLIWGVHFLINRGIREASFVNILFSSIKILTLIIVILVFIGGFHWAKFRSNFHVELKLGSMLDQIKSTMLVTVWDFTGIEAACIFALRARSMQDVARATMLGAVVVCLIDIAVSILPFGMLGGDEIRALSTPSTAGLLATGYGAIGGEAIRLAVVISVAGALLAWAMLATNMFYVAAEDGTMPKFLLKLNKRNVPYNSVLISSLLTQIFVIMAYFTNAVYLMLIQLATSLILLPYLLSALFAMQLIIRERKVDYLAIMKGVLAVLYGLWLVYSGGMMFLALACLMYLAGSILYFIARKEHSQSLLADKFEAGVFILLVVVTICSVTYWSSVIATLQ